jgi:hypothetical protein
MELGVRPISPIDQQWETQSQIELTGWLEFEHATALAHQPHGTAYGLVVLLGVHRATIPLRSPDSLVALGHATDTPESSAPRTLTKSPALAVGSSAHQVRADR